MDRPEELPEEAAEQLEKLDEKELRAASQYAQCLARQRKQTISSSSTWGEFISHSEGETYYDTGMGDGWAIRRDE